MRKKKQVTVKKRLTASVMAGIMVFSMLAGLPTAVLTAEAADYGLAGPRLDKAKHTVVYDCVYFGNYWQEDTNSDGKANKKDNKTPIKWRVLSVDGDDAFLIADQNLDMQRYNDTCEDKDGNDLDITWEVCTMRSWLNGYGADSNICGKDYTGAGNSFINNAFSTSEKNAVKNTALSNKDNPDDGTAGGNDTTDKIFLLSLEDIANEAYGFTNYRNKTGESDSDWGNGVQLGKEYYGTGADDYYDIYDYAKLRTNTDFAMGSDTASGGTWRNRICTGSWWLRSPGRNSSKFSIVYPEGYVIDFGSIVVRDSVAACPALHLNLSSSDVWSNAGTVTCKPGNVGGIASGDNKPDTHNHTWDNGTVTKQPTETAEGVKTYKCTGCGETKTESIAKLKKVTPPTVSKVSNFKAAAKKKSLKLTWKKLSDVDGYQLEYSTKSNFKNAKTKNIAKGKTSYTVSKLKAKKKYYVRICAYKNYKDASGKSCKAYGKWVKLNKKTK